MGMISILSKNRRHVFYFLLVVVASLCSTSQAFIRYEAEGAELDGIELPAEFTLEGYSGTGYVFMNGGGGAGMIFTIEAPAAGYYELTIRYLIPTNWSNKQNNIVVNGNTVAAPYFTMTDVWADWPIIISLFKGENIIEIRENWGNMYVDYIELPFEGPPQTKAAQPQPENHADYLLRDVILSWISGEYAATHDVYFGTNFDDINDGIADVLLSEGQDANYYDPGILEFGTTYYWRVDEVNAQPLSTIYKGNIWSFTTEPVGYQLPAAKITNVTASSFFIGSEPNNTINGSGLDINEPDLHSNKDADMWISGSSDPGEAWIQYEFEIPYKLHKMLVWNYNGGFPLNYFGLKDVKVEYSTDGQTWNALTDVPQFAIAPGTEKYAFNTTVDFGDIEVKYVKLTANSNWGSVIYDQYGLSEVRFLYIPVRAREPYPADMNDVPVDVTLTWRAGREAQLHDVYISTDENDSAKVDTVSQMSYGPLSLDLGADYYWRIDEVNGSTTWTGDTWSFRTQEYILVEDFESYTDDEPDRIFDMWSDGWDDDNNGSTMGYPDPDLDAGQHYVETDVVYDGKQSGPLLYDNTAPVNYSEAVLALASAQDWTSNAADEVVISFRGNAAAFYESDDGYIAMSAEGVDIYDVTDEFRYAYKSLTGNGSITVRVDSIENVNVWSKAGIMIRNTLDPNDIHVTAVLAASGTAELEYRGTKGGTTATQDVVGLGSPCWLRITRSGDDFTVERSKDGVNWLSFETDANSPSTVTVDMGNTVYIGLVVTSHTANVPAAATFYNPTTTGTVTGADWTVEAIGDIDQGTINTIDKLYIALEDSTGHRHDVYAPVATAVGWGSWYEWIIPQSEFTGVDMTRIKKIIVGVGDPGEPMHGKGTIFIDDIGYGRTFVEP